MGTTMKQRECFYKVAVLVVTAGLRCILRNPTVESIPSEFIFATYSAIKMGLQHAKM